MNKNEYFNLAMSLGVDFDDAFWMYGDLKDKDRQTIIDTLSERGRIAIVNMGEKE